jgi:hypothetical protein
VPIPVAQYTLDDEYVATYLTARAAAFALRTPRHDKIGECCKGLASEAGGFKWRFATPEQAEQATKVASASPLVSVAASHKRSRADEEEEEQSSDSRAGSVAPAPAPAKRPRPAQDERMRIEHLL